MRIVSLLCLVVTLLAPVQARAQLVQTSRVEREVDAVEKKPDGTDQHVKKTVRTVARTESTGSSDMVEGLPQANVALGTMSPSVTVQALKLYLHPTIDWPRFYLSTMLPTQTQQTTAAGGGNSQPSAKPTPGDYLRSSLLDESGGLVNAAFGIYGVPAATQYIDDKHGLVVDVRAGVKLLESPTSAQAAQTSTSLANTVSPFLNGLLSLTYQFPLYSDTTDPTGARKQAGGLVVGLSSMWTYATDGDFATLFQTPLVRSFKNVNVNGSISLPGVMYIQLSGTAWSNDPSIGKRFVVSFNAMRQ